MLKRFLGMTVLVVLVLALCSSAVFAGQVYRFDDFDTVHKDTNYYHSTTTAYERYFQQGDNIWKTSGTKAADADDYWWGSVEYNNATGAFVGIGTDMNGITVSTTMDNPDTQEIESVPSADDTDPVYVEFRMKRTNAKMVRGNMLYSLLDSNGKKIVELDMPNDKKKRITLHQTF